MVLDDLGTSLRSSLDKLQGKSRLSESDVEEIVKEIQRSLLSADVDVSLVMELSDSIKTRALEEGRRAARPRKTTSSRSSTRRWSNWSVTPPNSP